MLMTKKVAIITCYKQPDYIRAVVLRQAISTLPDTQPVIIKNSHTGLLRYPEVILKLIWIRLTQRPHTYLITFRGYEILPLVQIITAGKKLLFDEFINLEEWVVYEHQKLKPNTISAKLLHLYYRFLLKRCHLLLADTSIHAAYSAKLMGIPREKYVVIPVGTDENVFKPQKVDKKNKAYFEVFYYGTMLPLHGVTFVCEAAWELAKVDRSIHFTIIGGGDKARATIEKWIKKGAHITFKEWVPFSALSTYTQKSDVCLGGPFGGTLQAGMVVTGKTYQFLAAAKPVIIGKIKQETAFIDKRNCLLVEQRSSRAIAQAILWAKNHDKQLATIATEGHKLFQSDFSIKKISQLIQPIL